MEGAFLACSWTVVRPTRLSVWYSFQSTEQIPVCDTPHSIHSIRRIQTDKLNSSLPEKYHRNKGRPANGQIIVNSLPESGWRPVENPKCDLV